MKHFLNFINKHKFKFLFVFGIISLIFIGCYFKPYVQYYLTDRLTTDDMDALGLENTNKLMIVAHPDDESLWGGNALIEDDYFVVCLTNGNNNQRKNEFLSVMEMSGDIGLILSYPDKIHNERSDWSFCKEDILTDLKTIIDYKDWDLIVTHNEDGEYGHLHHIMTHNMVAEVCDKLNVPAKQFYFGKYYKRGEIYNMSDEELSDSLSLLQTEKKIELICLYESQSKTTLGLSHMLPFEKFIERTK